MTKTPPKPTEAKKRGRPISQFTPAEKKQMSLEEEAREFFNKKVQEGSESAGITNITLLNFYAGSALSGLISSGRYNRADELVEEAFRYAHMMVQSSK